VWIGVAVLPGSRLAMFLPPHRGAGVQATPSMFRALYWVGGVASFKTETRAKKNKKTLDNFQRFMLY
jgi:hypothetical protein